MASLLTPLFLERAENQKIINYIKANNIVLDDESFTYNAGSIPFSYEDFETFCDEFFSLHKDTMVEADHGMITVNGEGLEVARLRGQGGMLTILRREQPQPSL